MKLIYVFGLIILLSLQNRNFIRGQNLDSASLAQLFNENWKSFKKITNLEVNDTLEDLRFKKIWEENYDFVNKHNLENDLNNLGYKLKLNDFAYMSIEEFTKKKCGLKIRKNLVEMKKKNFKKNRKTKRQTNSSSNRPVEYDLRKLYPIPVRDQRDCGGCYAFSAVASIEFQAAAKRNVISLSEQNLIDCSRSYGNFGCDGGTMDQAFDYVRANRGINSLWFYPYTAKEGKCAFRSIFTAARITSYEFVDTEDELEDAIFRFGAVSCGIDASLKTFQLYSSGVYNDTTCSKQDINHAVNVVGYTKDYFILRNSWGNKWGIDGYFYLPKGINACGLVNYCLYPIL